MAVNRDGGGCEGRSIRVGPHTGDIYGDKQTSFYELVNFPSSTRIVAHAPVPYDDAVFSSAVSHCATYTLYVADAISENAGESSSRVPGLDNFGYELKCS